MTQYNSLNVKLSNSQLNKLKPAMKKWNWCSFEIIIKYDSDDKTNFLHKLLLTNTHVANLRKDFANNSSTDIKNWILFNENM